MKLSFVQGIFPSTKYEIFDEYGEVCYRVKRDLFGRQMRFYDAHGQYLGQVRSFFFRLLPKYELYEGDRLFGRIKERFSWRKSFDTDCEGWQLSDPGEDGSYTVTDGERIVGTVRKEWVLLKEKYAVEAEQKDVLKVLLMIFATDVDQLNRD